MTRRLCGTPGRPAAPAAAPCRGRSRGGLLSPSLCCLRWRPSPTGPARVSETTPVPSRASSSTTPRPYTPASGPCPSRRSERPPAPDLSRSPDSLPHLQAQGHQLLLHIAYRQLAEMEDGRGQGSIRPAFGQRLVHVPCRAGTARGDNGQPDGAADRARQLYVVSGVRAVVVHRREQDLPRSQLLAEGRPLDRVASGRIAAAVAVHLPAGSVFSFSRVDRQHDALRAEDLSASRQQSRVGEG